MIVTWCPKFKGIVTERKAHLPTKRFLKRSPDEIRIEVQKGKVEIEFFQEVRKWEGVFIYFEWGIEPLLPHPLSPLPCKRQQDQDGIRIRVTETQSVHLGRVVKTAWGRYLQDPGPVKGRRLSNGHTNTHTHTHTHTKKKKKERIMEKGRRYQEINNEKIVVEFRK